MKKSYLTIAIAAITFAACSDNTVKNDIEEELVEIGFASDFVEKGTKADITLDWMKTANSEGRFGVYSDKTAPTAFTVFTNEKVNYGSDWTHETVRFWDKGESAKYNFYAYAPYLTTDAASGPKVAYSEGKFTFSGLSVFTKITAAGVDDICVADPKKDWTYAKTHDGNLTGTDATDGHVTFDFNHVLSKLIFKFKTTIESGATITITNVDLALPTASASWAQTANTAVAGTTTFTSYTASAADTYTTEQFSGSGALSTTAAELTDGAQYIVVPTNATQASHAIGIKVTYNITYGSGASAVTEEGCIATGSIKTSGSKDMAFVQNYVYTVTVTVDPAKIEFDVNSVKGWTNAADANNGGVELQ